MKVLEEMCKREPMYRNTRKNYYEVLMKDAIRAKLAARKHVD